nr:hypothetical protein [Ralstonia sp. ASV6]
MYKRQSQGGGSASFSHSNGNASGNYAGVNEQSGIQALSLIHISEPTRHGA